MKLVSRHLDIKKTKLKVFKVDTICAFTGKQIKEGVLKKNLIKSTFTDHELLKYKSDYVSVDIAVLIENFKGRMGLRNFSFYASKKELIFLKRETLLEFLMNITDTPFRVGVTYGGKKHIAYKSFLNHDKENFKIITDIGVVNFEKEKAREMAQLAQPWYTVVPEKKHTKALPTFFTKDEIKGLKQPDHKKVKLYGITKFFTENKKLEKFRDSALFNLIIYSLNKKL